MRTENNLIVVPGLGTTKFFLVSLWDERKVETFTLQKEWSYTTLCGYTLRIRLLTNSGKDLPSHLLEEDDLEKLTKRSDFPVLIPLKNGSCLQLFRVKKMPKIKQVTEKNFEFIVELDEGFSSKNSWFTVLFHEYKNDKIDRTIYNRLRAEIRSSSLPEEFYSKKISEQKIERD